MCDPGTAIAAGSLVLSAGSAITQHSAEKKAADANEKSAKEAERFAVTELGQRQVDEAQSAAQQKREVNRSVATAKGDAIASAAEAGVGGMVMEAMLGNYEAQGLRATDAIDQTLVVTLDQLQRMKLGAKVDAANRINTMPQPSLVSTGLKIGSAAIDFGATLASRKPKVGS